MLIRAASSKELASIRGLLGRSGLPTADLDASTIDWTVAVSDAGLDGVIGLESFADVGLLRSLVVAPAVRRTGLATLLVHDLETRAHERGIRRLVLLTQTAKEFFARRGYATIERSAAPSEVQDTTEFRSLCPASATCMAKTLRDKRVLFVCVENSNRSQMAEAFAHIHGRGSVSAMSAGSRPSGTINPKAMRFMAEVGYDLSQHKSKSLDDVGDDFDAVVTMGCGDSCPLVPAKRRLNWNLPDPKDMPDEDYRAVRDDISRRVRELLGDM